MVDRRISVAPMMDWIDRKYFAANSVAYATQTERGTFMAPLFGGFG
jgi:hypothetical protein